MPLSPGTRVGPYEVVAPLGSGGMGEVYRAHDTKLGRDVALKVLPDDVAGDPECLKRFEREARALAALNHPHIAQIYGFEDAPSTGSGQAAVRALVMELVPGESLEARIARIARAEAPASNAEGVARLQPRRLPVGDALEFARQVANGLEAAHDKGIIHRDLKPANVQVTPDGQVKILDFGLAKAPGSEVSGATADAATSPTLTAGTQHGMILGTAAYMSPEQARGLPVDARTDIWAFGGLLYEMLTGARAFPGPTATDLIAQILERDPDWTKLPPETPAPVRRLLERCLRKDPKQRLHHIADARFTLEDAIAALSGGVSDVLVDASGAAAPASPPPTRAIWRHPLPLGLATASLALVTTLIWVLTRTPADTDRAPTHVSITLPADQALTPWGHAVSPDGRHIVYSAVTDEGPPGPDGNVSRLFHRDLSDGESRPLPGTEGAGPCFFSPDGEWVAFASRRDLKLKKIALAGGGPVSLVELSGSSLFSPGVWVQTDHILIGDGVGPLRRVPASGGKPETIVPRSALETGEMGMTWPAQHGSAVVFTPRLEAGLVAVYAEGRRRTLLRESLQAQFSPTGHLLFWRTADSKQVDLWASAFDATRSELRGSPVSVLSVSGTSRLFYQMSRSGTLVYRPGDADYPGGRFKWEALDGRPVAAVLPDPPPLVTRVSSQRVSPDGRSVVHHESGPGIGRLIVTDVATGARRVLSSGQNYWVAWTPDSRRVIYQVPPEEPGGAGIFWKPADGSAPPERLTTNTTWQQPQTVTPDGRALIYQETGGLATRNAALEDNYDLWLLPLVPRGEARPLLRTKANEKMPHLSRDGRWMAYVSDETGREEIWVRAFPPEGSAAIQVSQSGGTEPVWAPDGKTLFYRDASGLRLFAAPVTYGVVPQFAAPVARSGSWYGGLPYGRSYDVTPDGRALLFAAEPTHGRELRLIFNFDEVIRRKMSQVAR